MDIDEAARRALPQVPRPGWSSTVFGHYALESGVALVVALAAFVATFDGSRCGLFTLLALLVVTSTALVIVVRQLFHVTRSMRAFARVAEGDLESAARLYDALVHERMIHPAFRTVDATSLATCALMMGQPERAIVLLRAIERSGALLRHFEPTLRERLVLSLLALGRADEARALLASMLARAGRRKRVHLGLELLVEALTGSVEVAAGLAESFAQPRGELPWRFRRLPTVAWQVAFGHLVSAWVWDRLAREGPRERRADAEGRRAAALHLAGRVPDFAYRYLAPAMPAFVAFCDRSAVP